MLKFRQHSSEGKSFARFNVRKRKTMRPTFGQCLNLRLISPEHRGVFQLLLLFSPESSLSPFLLLTLTLPPVQFLKVTKSSQLFPLLFLFTFSVVSPSSALLKSRHVCASKNLILFYCIYHSYILRISKKWRFLPMFFLLKFRADRIFYLK